MKKYFMGGIAVLMSSGMASALESKSEIDVKAAPAAVWAAIGDFCDLPDWHPIVAKCDLKKDGDKTTRILTIGEDKAPSIEEVLTHHDGASYKYDAIKVGPLPIKNYKSHLSIKPNGTGTHIDWQTTYDANGKPDAEVQKLMDGIYSDGVKGIKALVDK